VDVTIETGTDRRDKAAPPTPPGGFARGVAAGEFRDVDPESTARLLLTAIDGARTHRVVYEDDTPAVVNDALVEHVLDPLAVDSNDGEAGDDAEATE
jgi:hypothetical protein